MQRLNLHIYPSPIIHESRIEKETLSISRMHKFDKIIIIGFWKEGLREIEHLDNSRTILRIKLTSRKLGEGTIPKILKFAEWMIRIILLFIGKKVVAVNIHNLATLPIGAFFKLIKRTFLIYDTHELETERETWSKNRMIMGKVLEKSMMIFVDKIIAVTASIGRWYSEKYNKPVHVVYNAPPYQQEVTSEIFRTKFDIPDNKTICIFQGALTHGRGIEEMLDVFTTLENSNFIIVFMGYGILVDKIQQAVDKSNNIFYHPAVSRAEIQAHTSSADLGLIVIPGAESLSYKYAMGNKFFEYLMARLPIIITRNFAEMSNLIEEYKIGIVLDTDDTKKIAEIVSKITTDEIVEMKKNIEKFIQEYNWENQERTLETVFKKIT